ncbi:Uncharacterized protein At4g00950 [Linum perenne]
MGAKADEQEQKPEQMEEQEQEPEEEEEEKEAPRLQLFSSPHSQMMIKMHQNLLQSSPLHTSSSAAASVPFRWEEHPGKPIHTSSSSIDDDDVHLLEFEQPRKKSLDLPPRMLIMEEDLYNNRSKYQSSSFRVVKRDWQLGSFRRTESSLDGRSSRKIGAFVEEGKKSGSGFFSSWKVLFKSGGTGTGTGTSTSTSDCSHSSYVFPASVDGGSSNNLSYDEEEGRCKEVKIVTTTAAAATTKISRSGSFSAAAKSHHFWATIYEGLKQVVPWRRNGKKSKDRGRFLS